MPKKILNYLRCSFQISCVLLFHISLFRISPGAPGWLSQLSVRLQLRSWSYGSWVRAPPRALCWQLRACSLLLTLCLHPLSSSSDHTLSFSQKQIKIKKKKRTSPGSPGWLSWLSIWLLILSQVMISWS